ncbi:MAG: recombinase RecA [Actinomycetales bacterium]|nr:MAG: recombinase RecA [Actinomycetales bacterium]
MTTRRPDAARLTRAADALAAAEQAAGLSSAAPPESGSGARPARRQRPRPGEAAATGKPDIPNGRVAGDAEPDPVSVARGIVLRQLAIGPRSRAQLERKLGQRGCDPEVARTVLDRMTDLGLVDDAAFAEQLVQSRRRTKGLSGAALRRELRDKGVDADLAARATGSLDPESERARAEELVHRKLRTMAGLDPQVQARRLAAMLARKGYPHGVAYAVVRDAVNTAVEHQRD